MDDTTVHRRSRSSSQRSQSGSVLSPWAFMGWPSGHRICPEISTASKGLVISNMAASSDSFVKHVTKLRSQFPADVRAKLEFYENANRTDDPVYQNLLFEKLYKIFICRLDPWPDPVQRSLGGWN